MTYWLYILQSRRSGRYYVGISKNPYRRLEFHNSQRRGYTSRFRPWEMVYRRRYGSKQEAQSAERRVKRWKSRKMIEAAIQERIVP